jgi:hypothetical protein
VAADAERSAAPAQGDPEPAASELLSERSAESASGAGLCKQAADRFAERSFSAAEPLEPLVWRALLPKVAQAVRAAQPVARLPESSSPQELQEAEAVLSGELAALVQPESWPRGLMPELPASPAARQALLVDARSEPEAA